MSGCGDRVPGWIDIREMEFVLEQMESFGPTGKILEVGSATGRLFDFLYENKPDWEYTAVDPWEKDGTRLQIDWSGPYEESNLGEVITKELFVKNCPFAKPFQTYFENFATDEKYDVISIGCAGDNIDWQVIYSKAKELLQPNGTIVARDIDHPKYKQKVNQAIKSNALRIGETRYSSCAVKKYPFLPWGTHKTEIDLSYHLEQANSMLNDTSTAKRKGRNQLNSFVKIPFKDSKTLMKYMNGKFNEYFDWHFEYFRSGEPAGLHTDYETYAWDHWGEKIDCHTIVGCIIPLDWTCERIPFTINYDRCSTVPRKLMYTKGAMRYIDNEDYIQYKTGEVDKHVAEYNPADTEYHKLYEGLKIHSVYKWEVGTMMLFDAARWHSSSWFLKDKVVPQVANEYKQSIIGFGSVDVLRN